MNTQVRAIGDRVERRRLARGWDQSELARRAGVSSSYVNRIEAGKYGRPSVAMLTKLAEALGCRLVDLTEPEPAEMAPGLRGELQAMGVDPVTEAPLFEALAREGAKRSGTSRQRYMDFIRSMLELSAAD
jgi:transcriptional regulator with XRE-family HTH domain